MEKRLLNVWKTKVLDCGLVLYFKSAVHVDTSPCLCPCSGLRISLLRRGVCRVTSLDYTSSTFPSSRCCCWSVWKAHFCSQVQLRGVPPRGLQTQGSVCLYSRDERAPGLFLATQMAVIAVQPFVWRAGTKRETSIA